jgi:hypothetical protein
MSGMLGGGAKTTQPVALAGIQVQTSSYGLPVPILYGAARIAMNLTYYTDFKAIKSSSNGGKSGKAGGGGSYTYTYTAAVAGAICEGPIVNTSTTWVNQTAQPSSTAGFSFFTGVLGQSPWSYLTANHPDQAAPYSGICYAAFGLMNLSSSATVPSYNFEIYGRLYATAPNGADADPSQVVVDLLSNPQYGAGFPAARIGSVVNNSEDYTIPDSPHTITVGNHAAFNYNLDVEDSSGVPFTCVSGAPGPSQYAFNAATGVYTFNAADSGAFVQINYVSTGTLSNYQNFCLASGLWISPVYAEQTQTSSLIDDIATYTYSEVVWSCGILTMVPRGSVAVSGNGYSYTPPSQAGFNLGDDDFVSGYAGGSSNDDPVLLKRTRISDQINDIKLEYLDRSNQYAPSIAEVSDQGLIDVYGRRADPSRQAHLFCDGNAANTSAQLLLQKEYILNTYTFGLDGRYCLFDPMDLDTLTDSGLGLSSQAIRILETTENDDGTITVIAEEYPVSLGSTAEYNLNQGTGYIADYRVSPGSVNMPVIFEPGPAYLSANSEATPQIVIGVSGANPNWGGCQVLISLDNVDYQPLGNIDRAATQGVLTATLATGSDPDTVNTLSVDLTQSFGALSSVSQLNSDNFIPACLAVVQNADGSDAELISFEQATLTAPYNYALGKSGGTAGRLRRGVYSTPIAGHAIGSQFCLLDDNVFTFDLPIAPVSYVGKTLYLKFLSINIYGEGAETAADVAPYIYDPTGIAAFVAPPSGVTISSGIAEQPDGTVQPFMQISWDASPDPVFDRYEVQWRTHTGPGPWLDQFVAANTTSLTIAPVAPVTAFDAQVRAVRSTSNTGPFFSAWAQDLNVLTVFKTTPPPAPTGLNVAGGYRQVTVSWTPVTSESDIAFYVVYYNTVNNLATAAVGGQGTLSVTIPNLALNTLYYVWVKTVDTSGNFSATALGPGEATTLGVESSDITGQIVEAQIAANSITAANLISGLNLVQVVTSIGSASSATGNVAYESSTGTLYRWNGSAWISSISAADIPAASLDITKFASGIAPVRIVSSLPGTATEGDTAVLTTNGKLYRYHAGAWTVATDGADILANSITTGSIAAGAVNASQIAAGAVTASKLYVGDTTSLILDPNFADPTVWTITTNGTTTPGYQSGISTEAQMGLIKGVVWSLSQFSTVTHFNYTIQSVLISCDGNTQYRQRALIRSFGANKNFYLWTGYYDNTQTYITATAQSFDPSSYVDPYGVSVTAASGCSAEWISTSPANAAYVICLFFVTNDGPTPLSTAGSGYWEMGNPRFERVTTGTLIADGAITTGKIAANAVTAAQIAAGTITASQIATGTLTAAQIAAGGITGTNIAGGTITGSNIAALTITAANISAGTITGDKITGNFFQGYSFTATSGSGSDLVQLYGGVGTSGGLNYGPYIRACDASGATRFVAGQWGSQYGLFVWNSSGVEILSASDLGVNVVGTSNIAANAATETNTGTYGSYARTIDNNTPGDGVNHFPAGTTQYAALAAVGETLVAGGSLQIIITIQGFLAAGLYGGDAYMIVTRDGADTGWTVLRSGSSTAADGSVTLVFTDTTATTSAGYHVYQLEFVLTVPSGPTTPLKQALVGVTSMSIVANVFKR